MRHFLARNMERTLSQQPLIPVGVLLKPLVKQATLYGYNNCDFDFFLTLAKHERLGLRHALLMLQFLGKVCLNDALHGRVSTVPFLVLVGRFHDSDVLHDFLEIFVEQALATLLNLHSQKAGDAASIRSTLCIELVAKLLHLPHPKLLKRIGPVVLQAHQQYVSLRNSEHPGLAALLHFADKNRNNPTLLLPATSPRHPKKSPRDVIESYADGYAAGPDSARRGNDAGGEIELDVRQEALAPPPMRRGRRRRGRGRRRGAAGTPPTTAAARRRRGRRRRRGAAAARPFMKKAGGADKKGAGGAYGRGGGKAAAPARRPPPRPRDDAAAVDDAAGPEGSPPREDQREDGGGGGRRLGAVHALAAEAPFARQARRGPAAVGHRDGAARGGGRRRHRRRADDAVAAEAAARRQVGEWRVAVGYGDGAVGGGGRRPG